MSRTVSGSMQTHLDSEVTSLATCWELTRQDGVTMYFTDHDRDIVFGGNTYLASTGFTRSALEETSNLAVDNMELMGLLDSASISADDIRAGLYDYAAVSSFLVNHEDPDTFSSIKLRTGFVGEATATKDAQTFIADFRGLLQSFSQNVGEIYQEECRADLGDSRCKVDLEPVEIVRDTEYAVDDLVSVVTDMVPTDGRKYEGRRYRCTVAGTTAASQPTYDTTVGQTTVDGTATFICEYSFTQYVEVDVVTSNRVFTITVPDNDIQAVDDWFKFGALQFIDGQNNFKAFEVKEYTQSTKTIELYISPNYDVVNGQLLKVYAGCSKNIQSACRDKFDNVVNFRGEPFIPGADQILTTPVYKSS